MDSTYLNTVKPFLLRNPLFLNFYFYTRYNSSKFKNNPISYLYVPVRKLSILKNNEQRQVKLLTYWTTIGKLKTEEITFEKTQT